jgi:KDO2-lipid IV(A) lauroyltransferase
VANQTNKLVDEFMDNLRRSQGIEIIKIHNAPRGVLTAFKNNRYVALMIDQDAGRDCVFVDFFGKLASTHRGPAVFHLKTQTPLVMSSCIRLKGPHYRVLFEDVHLPPLEGTQEEKNTQIMAHLTKLLEEKVRQHPEQYFWMHKRWKTRPQ